MSKSYATIAFDPEKCDGCDACVKACAAQKCGTAVPEGEITPELREASRIEIVRDEVKNAYGMVLCRQCSDPECAENCPAGALAKNQETGAVEWDQDRCVDCGLCTLICSYGGIAANAKEGKVMKCDMCGGDPACVKACDRGAMAVKRGSEIFNAWGDKEDLIVPGISACLGCNTELVLRHTLRKIGSNTVVAYPPGCAAGVGAVGVNGKTATKVPSFHPLLTNTASMLAGVKRYYNRIGRDVTMLTFAGDGGTADVGFQSLSGAAERGEQMIYICVDNEGYMNTGVQRSGTTPYGSWTSTTPVGKALRGKTRDAKYLPLMMVMNNCEYVATASMAFMEDYYEKLDKATEAAKRGMAYLHVFSPCPTGWRFATDQLIEVGRRAVRSNLVPLWEYDSQDSELRFTHPVEDPLPVKDYLSLIGKFRHLDDAQLSHIETMRDRRIQMLQNFS